MDANENNKPAREFDGEKDAQMLRMRLWPVPAPAAKRVDEDGFVHIEVVLRPLEAEILEAMAAEFKWSENEMLRDLLVDAAYYEFQMITKDDFYWRLHELLDSDVVYDYDAWMKKVKAGEDPDWFAPYAKDENSAGR